MNRKERIVSFSCLGDQLKQYLRGANISQKRLLDKAINDSHVANNWFIPRYVHKSLEGIVNILELGLLNHWIDKYPEVKKPKTVACVLAGNIPMVGFHDMLCVLLSGHKFVGKLSSKDLLLLPALANLIMDIDDIYKDNIIFSDSLRGIDYDAVIATGSNNSARYFEQYFGHKPNIIRKGRSSIAVLSGEESSDELRSLAHDIFLYFGLGCRNVSKIYIPEGFEIQKLFPYFEEYKFLQNHHKLMNNYDYNRSILLVNQEPFYETGFALFVENSAILSPISVIYYENYNNVSNVWNIIEEQKDTIQCVVSNIDNENCIPLGQSQFPQVDTHADGVDTLEFLTSL